MSQTITRMYANAERANAAAHELKNNRFVAFDDVHVITGGAQPNGDAIVASIMKALVLKAHARVLAEGVKRGGALVVVHAPFGCAVEAIDILESHGPVDSGVPDARDAPVAWDDAAPCSSALHIPVLLSDASTFSTFWNVPPLLKGGATTGSALGLPEVSASRGPFTGTIGLPLLSNKPSIFSSMLGLPVLMNARSR